MASIFEKNAKAQAIVVGLPIFAGILTILLTQITRSADASTPYFWFGIIGMLGGYIMLVRSKWSQIRQGDLFSWGLDSNSQKMKPIYILSYLMMAGGFGLAAFSGLF